MPHSNTPRFPRPLTPRRGIRGTPLVWCDDVHYCPSRTEFVPATCPPDEGPKLAEPAIDLEQLWRDSATEQDDPAES